MMFEEICLAVQMIHNFSNRHILCNNCVYEVHSSWMSENVWRCNIILILGAEDQAC
jgi:hypothetical protein